jgi:hypothetical protein
VVRKHHTVPTEILNKYLPKDIANNPLVRGKKGDPNIWKIPGNVHDQIHTGAGGGPWNQRWKEELKPFGPNGENATVEDVVGIRNKLAKEFGLEQYRPGSETAVSWLNQTKGYVAGAVFLGIEALDYTDPYSAFCAIMGAKDAGAGSDIIPGLTVQVIGFDMPSNQSSAGGGFVIYPNKPNSNMMRSVYAK